MSEVIVYSYGVGEFTAQVFNAVASIIYKTGFSSIMQAMFLIVGLISAVQYSKTRDVSILMKSALRYTVVLTLLISQSYTVIVKDTINKSDVSVSNVPLGLALPASYITTFFYGLTTLFETALHKVDDLSYSKSGYLFASHLVKGASNIRIVNPEFKRSLNSFIEQCVFYDIYHGRYTIKDLMNTDDAWVLVTSRPSRNRAFMLDNKVTICSDGVTVLKEKMNEAINDSALKYGKVFFPGLNDGSEHVTKQIRDQFLSSVTSSYSYLTNLSKGASSILTQNLFVNAINDAALQNPELGIHSYAVARANAQKSVSNTTTGIMMGRWLPAMMGATECMMYAMFILVVMYSLFPNGEKVFGNYVISLIWVASWPVVYAILNFGFTWAISVKSGHYGLSFYDNSHLSQVQYDMSSLFGYFTMTVPYIAWNLVNLSKQGLGVVFNQMSQLVGGSTQSLAMASSSEAVAGNFSIGSTNMDTHALSNDNAFKHDHNVQYADNSISGTSKEGTTFTDNYGGNSSFNMEGSTSRSLFGINLSNKIGIHGTQQLERSLNAAKSEDLSYTENMTSTVRDLYEMGSHVNQGKSISEHFGVNLTAGQTESLSELASNVDKYAQDHSVSAQDAMKHMVGDYKNTSVHLGWNSNSSMTGGLGKLLSGVDLGVKGSMGDKVENDSSTTHQASLNHSESTESYQNNSYNDTIDSALRAVKEQGYRATTDSGSRLVDNISSSYDKAMQSSDNLRAHLQEAENYRELASYSKDNGAAIDYNANQEFIDHLSDQTLPNSNGRMGMNAAEALIRHNPDVVETYAGRFVQHKARSLMESWSSKNITQDTVNTKFNEYKSGMANNNQIQNDYLNNKNRIQSKEGSDLSKTEVDDSLKKSSNAVLKEYKSQIDNHTVHFDNAPHNNNQVIGGASRD